MRVRVKVFAMFRELLGTDVFTVELDDDSTVFDLIEWISKNMNEKFRDEVLDEKGRVKKYVKILVNGRNIEFLDGLKTRLKHDDVVTFFPPVAGGLMVY
ncbi:MAG: ubiquitin-like small modifier protein 1 [Candidatus Baldrarchaeia archaeon]